MKQFTQKTTINDLQSGNSSYYGNPSYFVGFITGNGYKTGKTASNAACAYMLCDSCINKEFEITYHITRNGNTIIDYIRAEGGEI